MTRAPRRAPIRAIARRPASLGLGLAGLAATEVDDPAAAAAILAELAAEPETAGLVLIEESLADALPPALRRRIARAGAPILVPFPGPMLGAGTRPPAEAEILEILRRAVGYRLRLR